MESIVRHQTTSDCEAPVLKIVNVDYSSIAIKTISTLTMSNSTCEEPIDGENKSLFLRKIFLFDRCKNKILKNEKKKKI